MLPAVAPVAGLIRQRAALGQQFPGVPVRQPVPQVPADRDRNHLPWEAKPANTEDEPGDAVPPVSL